MSSERLEKILYPLCLILLATVLTGSYLHLEFTSFTVKDAFDYAQLARNIAESEAYETDTIYPLSWALVPDLQNHPDFLRAPLYPLLAGAGFRLFGQKPIVLVGVSVISFLVFLFVLYRLGTRIEGRRAGFLAGVYALFYVPLFTAAITGMTEALFILLFYAGVLTAVWERSSPVLLGILTGLAYLTRLNAWFFIIGVLYIALKTHPPESKKRYLMVYFATFVGVLSPWIVRNVLVIGSPLYQHQIYELASFEGPLYYDVYTTFDPPDPYIHALANPVQWIGKWLSGIFDFYRNVFLQIGSGWPFVVLATIWVGFQYDHETSKAKTNIVLFKGLMLALILQLLVLSAVRMNMRHYLPFFVCLPLFSGAVTENLLRSKKIAGCAIMLLIVLFTGVEVLTIKRHPLGLPRDNYRVVRQIVPEKAPLLTNQVSIDAWLTDRTALLAPANYEAAEEHYPSFDYVFLTPEKAATKLVYPRRIFRSYTTSRSFKQNFKIERKFRSGARLYRRRFK